jgi:3-deoxy-7-phosphoheptulonate synthase
MLIVMKARATNADIDAVCLKVEAMGFIAHPIAGSRQTAIGVTGNLGAIRACGLEEMPEVQEVVYFSRSTNLFSREYKKDDTVIRFPGTDASIGGKDLCMIAGPCAIEGREQAFAIAEQVVKAGARFFRGGAYKPRTSPYAFQGLGLDGLKIMAEIREHFGLRIVTEAMDQDSLELVEAYADVIQIGSRNMQNYSLLKQAGRMRKPVLLKRGMSASMEEFLMSAEYIMNEGNFEVILCERGIRTFADHARNTLDLSIVPAVKSLSHLPILVDPSHGTGSRNKVLPLSRAAIAVGADGLMVEVHHDPAHALSDGRQSILPAQFEELMAETRQIAPVVHRDLQMPMAKSSFANATQ